MHKGCYNLLHMFLFAKCSFQGSFEQQPALEKLKVKGQKNNNSFSRMVSAMFNIPSMSVEATWGSVEDISSQEKITRLADELVRELDRAGDSEIRRQVMQRITNTDLLSSRRGHFNERFMSDEGNASISETSSVLHNDAITDNSSSGGKMLLTEAIIENCQLPEITEGIAREEDASAIVEEADQFLTLHPQHQDLEKYADNELEEEEEEEQERIPCESTLDEVISIDDKSNVVSISIFKSSLV